MPDHDPHQAADIWALSSYCLMPQGLRLVCLEDIAWRNGWIDAALLEAIASGPGGKITNGQYLNGLLKQPNYSHGEEAGCVRLFQLGRACLVRAWLFPGQVRP